MQKPPALPRLPIGSISPMRHPQDYVPAGEYFASRGRISSQSSLRSACVAPRSIPIIPDNRAGMSRSCGPTRHSMGSNGSASRATFSRRFPTHQNTPSTTSLASRIVRSVSDKMTTFKERVSSAMEQQTSPMEQETQGQSKENITTPTELPKIPIDQAPLGDRKEIYKPLKKHETERLLSLSEQRTPPEKRDRYVVLPGGSLAKPRDIYVESLPDGQSSFGNQMLVMSLDDLLRRYDALDEHYKKLKLENSQLRNVVWKIYSGMPSVAGNCSYGSEMVQHLGQIGGLNEPRTMDTGPSFQ